MTCHRLIFSKIPLSIWRIFSIIKLSFSQLQSTFFEKRESWGKIDWKLKSKICSQDLWKAGWIKIRNLSLYEKQVGIIWTFIRFAGSTHCIESSAIYLSDEFQISIIKIRSSAIYLSDKFQIPIIKGQQICSCASKLPPNMYISVCQILKIKNRLVLTIQFSWKHWNMTYFFRLWQ